MQREAEREREILQSRKIFVGKKVCMHFCKREREREKERERERERDTSVQENLCLQEGVYALL